MRKKTSFVSSSLSVVPAPSSFACGLSLRATDNGPRTKDQQDKGRLFRIHYIHYSPFIIHPSPFILHPSDFLHASLGACWARLTSSRNWRAHSRHGSGPSHALKASNAGFSPYRCRKSRPNAPRSVSCSQPSTCTAIRSDFSNSSRFHKQSGTRDESVADSFPALPELAPHDDSACDSPPGSEPALRGVKGGGQGVVDCAARSSTPFKRAALVSARVAKSSPCSHVSAATSRSSGQAMGDAPLMPSLGSGKAAPTRRRCAANASTASVETFRWNVSPSRAASATGTLVETPQGNDSTSGGAEGRVEAASLSIRAMPAARSSSPSNVSPPVPDTCQVQFGKSHTDGSRLPSRPSISLTSTCSTRPGATNGFPSTASDCLQIDAHTGLRPSAPF